MPGLIEIPTNPAWNPAVPLLLETDLALGAETQAAQNGDLNLQAIALAKQTTHLKNEVEAIKTQLPTFVTSSSLSALDLTTLALENKRQIVTVSSAETTKNINFALGAIVSITLNNTANCNLVFGNTRQSLSGILIFTAIGADRTIVLPPTWQPTELSRNITVRAGQKRMMSFEVEQVAVTGASPAPEIVIASGISEKLLTT